MKSTINAIVIFFVVIPLLLLSYQLGTPGKYFTGASISAYFNRPPLKLPLLLSSEARSAQEEMLPYQKPDVTGVELGATAALAWDFKRDIFLFSKNIDEARPVASLTKLVSAAIIMNYAQEQEEVAVSKQAILVEGDSGNLQEGEILTVRDLLAAVLLESSNDAIYALAEYTGKKMLLNLPSEENGKIKNSQRDTPIKVFIKAMNKKFNDLGLKQSNFTDPSGLEDSNSFSSARDFAKFIKYLRDDPKYAVLWNIMQLKTYQTQAKNGIVSHSFNSTNPFLEELNGVIGGKTGYTNKALGNMLLVMPSPDGASEIIYLALGSYDRFGDIRKMIDWSQTAWEWPLKK